MPLWIEPNVHNNRKTGLSLRRSSLSKQKFLCPAGKSAKGGDAYPSSQRLASSVNQDLTSLTKNTTRISRLEIPQMADQDPLEMNQQSTQSRDYAQA